MDDLERQVRETLIEERLDEFYEDAQSDPELFELMLKTAVKYICAREDGPDRPPLEERERQLLPVMRLMTQDPAYAKAMWRPQAERELYSYKDLMAMVKDAVRDDARADELCAAFKELFLLARTHDRYVNRLVSIARQEGVALAISRISRYAVLKEFFRLLMSTGGSRDNVCNNCGKWQKECTWKD